MLFQWLFTIIFVLAEWFGFRRWRQGILPLFYALLWGIGWIGAAYFVWRPTRSTQIAQVFGLGRGADFLLYVAVILLAIGWLWLVIQLERQKREMTKLVSRLALKELEKQDR